jgi:hypothetical protein
MRGLAARGLRAACSIGYKGRMLPFLIITLAVILIIVGVIWSHLAAKKRREAMQRVARSLNCQFRADKDYSLDQRYDFLNKLCQGNNRYGYNIISGDYQGHHIMVFDYHYETYSTDSKGRRQTHHHHFSFFILHLDANFPELLISREGWTSKIVQFFGFDDIDFESAEFSRRFLVKSPDKRFAYDICHGRMIEYLLHHSDLSIEIEKHCLTLFFRRRLYPEQIEPNLKRLVAVRQLFPEYLMN